MRKGMSKPAKAGSKNYNVGMHHVRMPGLNYGGKHDTNPKRPYKRRAKAKKMRDTDNDGDCR